MPDTQTQQRQQILDSATTTFRRLLNFRRPFDALRLQFYAQYLAKRQPIYFPDNVTKRSNTSVPYAWANVEEINSRVQDAYFGMEPWLEVRPRGANDGPAAEAMDLVLNYMLRKADFPRHFETLVRNILIYGHCALKVDWDWDFDTVNYPEPIPVIDPRTGQPMVNPQTGQPMIRGYKPSTKQIPRACPKFIPIDVYDFLLDPDGGITAHLTERTWGQIKREALAKPDLYFPEALQELGSRLAKEENPDSCIIRIAEIWNDFEKTTTVITTQDTDAVAYKDTRAAYRSTGSYSPYKRKVFAQPPILLWYGDNPFLHKRSPVLHTGYVKLPNEPYGIGAIEPISELSDSLDRFTNMIADNWNLGINRRYAYDANLEIDHEALNNFNIPGGKVGLLGDPNKAIMALPFFTPNAGDYQILGIYKNFIELASGVSDFYTRGIGSSPNSTATGINDVISESSHRFKLFIRNLEFDIVRPMLQIVTSMIQQFTTDAIEVGMTESQPAIAKYPVVQPEQLIGNYNFELVAANYTSNKIIKQRNFLAFANWAAQTPYWNQYEGLREVAKVFEIRNTARVLNNPQMVEMQQQQAQQTQLKLALAEKLLDTESKMLVAEARTVSKEGSNIGQDHALKVQSAIEEWLQQLGDMPGKTQPSPQMTPTGVAHAGGRPRGVQQEGAIPGAGVTSVAREVGQGLGANGIGLQGMGEANAIRGT